MARPTTVLIIFFVAFNAIAGMMMATGVAAMLGVDTQVGEDDRIDDANESAHDIETGSSMGDTLFGMYNTLGQGFEALTTVVFAGPIMLHRAGVPLYISGMLSTLMVFVVAFDLIAFVRGFNL